MKLVKKTEFDSLVAQHSSHFSLVEKVPGVVQISFGPQEVHLAEDAARDFLYQLTGFFARKDLQEYENLDSPTLNESKVTLKTLSVLRGSTI